MSAQWLEPSAIRLPDPARTFGERAARLRSLAEGAAHADWLWMLSRVAEGQRLAVRDVVPAVRAPAGGPPLTFDRLGRDPAWRKMLGLVISAAVGPGLPGEALEALRRLAAADAARLEALADQLLAGAMPPHDLASAPFVGAALQAWFTVLAGRLEPSSLRVRGTACPACGAPPVAGVVQAGTRRRYLHCSLCGVGWNVPRLTCVSCANDTGLTYFHVEGDAGAKAEACEDCGGYLKLFDLDKRAGAEPMADDAATLPLDRLASSAGFERIGVNPWLWAAAAEAPRARTTQPAV